MKVIAPMSVQIDPADQLLRARQVAEWLGTTEGRLANMRSLGFGPPYIKVHHAVRYRRSAVEQYLADNTVSPPDAA
jgi:predicted DNA-binding transcriptional regulator AlpA